MEHVAVTTVVEAPAKLCSTRFSLSQSVLQSHCCLSEWSPSWVILCALLFTNSGLKAQTRHLLSFVSPTPLW